MYKLVLPLLLSLSVLAEAKSDLIETDDISQAFSYLEKDTLFVFDLDNTLVETTQHLGSDQWVSYKLNHLMKEGHTIEKALTIVIPILREVYQKSEMRLVDPAIPDLLHKLHKKGVPMVGLTKRDPALSQLTLEKIAPLHIDFSKTSPFQEEFVFDGLNGTLHKNGVVFVGSGVDKAPVLMAFIKKLKKMPKKIIMIDDKMSYVENTAKLFEPLDIHFVGIRYGGADARVKAFDPQIAELQLEHSRKIISDEEAMHLLQIKDHSTATAGPKTS